MAITLTYGATTISLSDDLLWTDEFAWRPVTMRTARTIAGSLIVESAVRAKGRPITLAGGADYGWVPRSALLQLQTAASIAGQKFTLTLRGTAYTVQFDNANDAITAQPTIDYSDPGSTDYYVVTLRFIEVEA